MLTKLQREKGTAGPSVLFFAGGLLAVTVMTAVGTAGELEPPPFLHGLLGAWSGRAVTTPIGPAPYDIHFAWTADTCVSGTADNGASRHTWTFCDAGGALALEFLSDFRGNTRPMMFGVSGHDERTVTFFDPSRDFMQVHVERHGDSRRITIIHDGELHVEIALERTAVQHVE